ncbi:glycosyltransferase [Leptolyngbya sp. FACHB-17]|uniref:glycosyltransferase n=2 Tax=unclassified Leptolyngbya TaxID=2650499 RepID=UPI001681BACA|nr:glycosyltransferase [Leptolyngbya sp. FACHB-17]
MKILHVIPSLSPSMGGPPQVAMNLVWALQQLGVDAEILTTNHDGATELDVPLTQRVNYQFREDGATVPVWFMPFKRPALKEFLFSPAATRWLWQNAQNYDVLDNHYLFCYAPTCAAAIARWHRVPYTVRTMGQLTPWALSQRLVKKQVYAALIERRNLDRAAAIHCTAPSEVEDVRNFGVDTPTLTLPLGVSPLIEIEDARSLIHEKYQISDATPIVLFLSRLHPKKRPELLLQSLHHLASQGLSFHAILAGDGDPAYVKKLHTIAQSLNLSDRITFPGLVLGKLKDCLLQGADLFVLPSFSENFGIAVAEALNARLPVVITPGIQIAPEIEAADAGLVVEETVESLALAIEQLLMKPYLREKLGKNGQHLAQSRYSWQAIAQQLIPAYRAIAARQPLPKEPCFQPISCPIFDKKTQIC